MRRVHPPHILLAGKNCHEVRENLRHLLDPEAIKAIDDDIFRNAAGLFNLGYEHFLFAKGLSKSKWRQRISRYYYGAYNAVRSIRLVYNGHYSQYSDDHKKIECFPADFPERNTYLNRLSVLRDDRNLCDYDHTANISDLVNDPDEAEDLVEQLFQHTKAYLIARGVNL
ncbi:MAG: hypothetical protein RLZZ609_1564 [Cyanobacteriota bacterium]|jgi:hypothetical protein